MTYVSIANMLVGTALSLLAARLLIRKGFMSRSGAGFQGLARTVPVTVVAFAIGITIFFLQGPASTDPIVIANAYAQVLTVSIAEIVVCLGLIGASFRSLGERFGRYSSYIISISVASILFGLYHIGHSPPFNAPATMLFLSGIFVFTALFFFITRDIYGTIAFHNFQGTFGVMQAINLPAYSQPLLPIFLMAAASVAALLASDRFLIRKMGQ